MKLLKAETFGFELWYLDLQPPHIHYLFMQIQFILFSIRLLHFL